MPKTHKTFSDGLFEPSLLPRYCPLFAFLIGKPRLLPNHEVSSYYWDDSLPCDF